MQTAHGEGGAGQQSDYGFQQADVQDNLRCDGVVSAARQCGEDFAFFYGYGDDREIDDEKYRILFLLLGVKAAVLLVVDKSVGAETKPKREELDAQKDNSY